MPSGRTHLVIEAGMLGLCAVAGAALVRGGSISTRSVAAFLTSFAFSMVFLTPDLDLVRSRPTRRWGKLSFLWRPYAKLFRHRGISHHVFWGPLTRIAYVGLLAAGAAAALGAALGRPLSFAGLRVDVWPILAGLYAPNILHTAADVTLSPRGRRTRAD